MILWWFALVSATAHTLQYLFLTPMWTVSSPIMMSTPDFALYECLCVRFDHPPSTTAVMQGTPS